MDYWDYIGWHDRFASPDFGAPASRSTPRRRAHRSHAASHAQQQRLERLALGPAADASRGGRGKPGPVRPASGRRRLGYPARGPQRGPGCARLTLALVQHGLASSIEAGENRGVRLEHDFVVRAMIERSAESTTFTLRHHFRPAGELDFAAAAVVALAHDDNGKLLQSLTPPWCP